MDSTLGTMDSTLAREYSQLTNQLENYTNIPKDLITSFRWYTEIIYKSDLQDDYSEPMPWIGMYIAAASLVCILAMMADLLHGFRTRKLWFPCRYFTLNAASLSMIAVAIKLPMDLSNSMPTTVDQVTKIGSMAFMCTMMANLLPSLASMDSQQLVTNIIALGVMVITLGVNVCIQVYTGVVSNREYTQTLDILSKVKPLSSYGYIDQTRVIASIYVAMLLFLLMIHICSALAILESKHQLELRYQEAHGTASKDLELKGLDVEKLKQHVSNYWIMAETGSPQFMIVCSVTTSASGVICVLGVILYILIMLLAYLDLDNHDSDYQWSIPMIFITQFVGVILGTVAPVSRCFASLSFKLSRKWIWDHIKVFKVESYWTQKLSDWKNRTIPFQFRRRKFKVVIEKLKICVLTVCERFQKIVVVTCKMLALFPIFFMPCLLFCHHSWKMLKVMFSAFTGIMLGTHEQLPPNKDRFNHYVLQFQDEMEPAEGTLKRFLKSLNRMIRKAEKQQPKNLMKLLEKSTSFEGVGSYDSHDVPNLVSKEYLMCWSLPLVTLSTIASSLCDIPNNKLDSLLTGVSEGLTYVTLVEESLNATDECARIQKAASQLWLEVEVQHKWLENKVKDLAPPLVMNRTREILEWFRNTSKNIIVTEGTNENTFCKSVCANSMYRITQTILLSYQENIDEISQETLFEQLSSLIADILAACLTNLPRVIAMKCHTNMIEKREASVHAAARLLGETGQIINTLQDREKRGEFPKLDLDELAFIDKWHDYFEHPFP